ncbi:HalOD1 output domain-containing protein [Natronosalvus vescus]|uniref:HalOD1 output domain-containing protein n=1 Tax=Natronosalvus vescus TaxID=2953881 RepID=UPI0020917154|nr:HalOD1 output domain-containing protein [Natronosalvus vescus]
MANSIDTDTPTAWATDPSLRVTEAVSDVDGIDPDACEPPLYTVIDPTALDQLIESPGIFRRGFVSIRYRGYDVTVTADGQVDLE